MKIVEHSIETNDSTNEEKEDMNSKLEEPYHDLSKEMIVIKGHPKGHVISDLLKGVTTGSSLCNSYVQLAFIFQIEPKSFKEAEKDEYWIGFMQEELNWFERNKVWELVPRPEDCSFKRTKWVLRIKLDKNDITLRNKPRLMRQEYHKKESIDPEETLICFRGSSWSHWDVRSLCHLYEL